MTQTRSHPLQRAQCKLPQQPSGSQRRHPEYHGYQWAPSPSPSFSALSCSYHGASPLAQSSPTRHPQQGATYETHSGHVRSPAHKNMTSEPLRCYSAYSREVRKRSGDTDSARLYCPSPRMGSPVRTVTCGHRSSVRRLNLTPSRTRFCRLSPMFSGMMMDVGSLFTMRLFSTHAGMNSRGVPRRGQFLQSHAPIAASL
jgi:hypothetical protein